MRTRISLKAALMHISGPFIVLVSPRWRRIVSPLLQTSSFWTISDPLAFCAVWRRPLRRANGNQRVVVASKYANIILDSVHSKYYWAVAQKHRKRPSMLFSTSCFTRVLVFTRALALKCAATVPFRVAWRYSWTKYQTLVHSVAWRRPLRRANGNHRVVVASKYATTS